MVIEVFLDSSRLGKGQSLVVVDEHEKRWDVADALSTFNISADSHGGTRAQESEVLLERWRIELKGSSLSDAVDFGPILPTIYKKSIVFIRSLFTMTRQSPVHRLAHHSLGKVVPSALEVRCRILTSETDYQGFDPIRHPLYNGGGDVVQDTVFGDLELPVGRLYASVTWRNNCAFRVEDSESLLSSQLGMTDFDFEPSVNQRNSRGRAFVPEPGSLPHRTTRGEEGVIQPIASAGTFHGYVATGTSPISTLRNYKPPGSDSSLSPPESLSSRTTRDVPSSSPIKGPLTSGRQTIRQTHERRPSIFKAGSLSGSSPLARNPEGGDSPASPQSITRPSGATVFTHGRKPSSLTQGMPASLRGGPPPDQAFSSSPKPGGSSRFSSSFSGIAQHRRARPSFGGNSKLGDDEQGSSGKQSMSSSVAQPGSGLLPEAGASSGSLKQDQDDISEFLKALESKKTLQSFDDRKGESSSTGRKMAVQLSKFQLMRETNTALTESMSSSMHLHRSSSSSSRQLMSVPGMAPASLSTASSPGKPLSPHTPHTPAIPSRLSENSIIDYNTTAHTRQRPADVAIPETTSERTNAIDIPLSPRIPRGGRPSSVAMRERSMLVEDDPDAAFVDGRRTMSAGNDDGEPPTLSALLSRNQSGTHTAFEATTQIRADAVGIARQRSISLEKDEKIPGSFLTGLSASPRRRYLGLGRGQTPPPGVSGSQSGRYSSSLTRPAATPDGADDEPLVFDISEIGQGRRSLEEGRGGTSGGSSRTGGFSRQSRGW